MLPSLGIMQPGAAVTDWMLAATCFACAMGLHFRKMEQKPRYYKMVVCALVAEALGCVAGGTSWAMGTNLKEQADLSLVDWIVVLCTVLGMCGQGLGLIAAAVAYYPTTSDETSELWWRRCKLAFLGFVAYEAAVVWSGADGTWVLQPAGFPILGWPALLPACRRRGTEATKYVSLAVLMNLIGGSFILVFDNRCAGTTCVTELAPWGERPCLAATTHMESCPFKDDIFNHAAWMHMFCVYGTIAAYKGFVSEPDVNFFGKGAAPGVAKPKAA